MEKKENMWSSMLTRSPKIMRQVNTIQEFQIKNFGNVFDLSCMSGDKSLQIEREDLLITPIYKISQEMGATTA